MHCHESPVCLVCEERPCLGICSCACNTKGGNITAMVYKDRKRPEYIKCIQKPDNKHEALCNRENNFFDWKFVDYKHACLTMKNEGRQVICEACFYIAEKNE